MCRIKTFGEEESIEESGEEETAAGASTYSV